MMAPFAKVTIANAAAMMGSHHRDARHFTPFYLYDLLIPESFLLVDTMLNAGLTIFSGIQVNVEKMKETLDLTGGLMTSEALLFELAKKTGKKETGMAIVHRIAMYSFENNKPFIDTCLEDEEIAKYFTKDEIKKILAPENYIGIASRIVDQVVNEYRKIV
jgi:adenylosuccinate lyase